MNFTIENYNRIIENNSVFRHQQNAIRQEDFAKIQEIAEYLYYGIRKTTHVSSNITSYGLKHNFEEELNYTTNGQFILGAIVAGFDHRSYHTCNPRFNMKMTDIKYLTERNQRRARPVQLPYNWNNPNFIRIR